LTRAYTLATGRVSGTSRTYSLQCFRRALRDWPERHDRPDARVGNGCKIQNNVSVYQGRDAGRRCLLRPSAVFTNVAVPRAFIDPKGVKFAHPGETGRFHRRECNHTVWIDDRSVCDDCRRAVVTKDVPSFALVVWVSRPISRLGRQKWRAAEPGSRVSSHQGALRCAQR